MSRTIWRYIATQYLINTLVLHVFLFGFIVTVDVFVNIRRFIRSADAGFAVRGIEEPGGLAVTLATFGNVVDLWWPRLLQLSTHTTGLLLVAAMGFTCAQLVRQRELVALLASGVSLHRLAGPFVGVALAFTGFQVVNHEAILPSIAPLLARDTGQAGSRDVETFAVHLAPDGQGRLFSATGYDDHTKAMSGVRILERGEDGSVIATISADVATWNPSNRAWTLDNGVRTQLPGLVGTRAHAVSSTLQPEQLRVRHMSGLAQSLGWVQLGRLIADPGLAEQEAKRLEQIRWGRVSALIANLLTLVAALPFFLRRTPEPMLGPSLRALPIGLAGLIAAAVATNLSLPGLPVWLSAAVPSLILAPLALALFTSIRS